MYSTFVHLAFAEAESFLCLTTVFHVLKLTDIVWLRFIDSTTFLYDVELKIDFLLTFENPRYGL